VAVNLKNVRSQVRGLSKALKQAHSEQQENSKPLVHEEEVPLTFKEKFLENLGRFMTACTALVVLEVASVFFCPGVFDYVYEVAHKNDFAEAEVFLSNQHPKLLPFLRVAKDAKYKCKRDTLRSCYLFLNEDANKFFEELAYGGKEKVKL
jgi:hypothetical protein